MENNRNNSNKTPNSHGGMISIGVFFLVVLRFIGDLASCAAPASRFENVVPPIARLDDLPALPQNPSQKLINELPPGQRQHTGSTANDLMPGGIGYIDNEADPFTFIKYTNIGDATGISDAWHPFNQSEKIQKTVLTSKTYDDRISNIGIFAIIPQTDSAFANVFKFHMSSSQKKQMAKFAELFQQLPNTQVALLDDVGTEQLFQVIRQHGDGGPLIIVGHSEAATSDRILVLPDGSNVLVSDIHQVCLDSGTRCLILTCYSDDFAITNEINLKESFSMTQRGYDIFYLLQQKDPRIPKSVTVALESGQVSETELIIQAMRYERVVLKASRLTIGGVISASSVTYVVTSKYKYDGNK